ncbi:helix-turn-helix domain-containing protein [Nonomuraea salmonea]|uniref:TetR/AcrR family transcriptional regulator n=1 Tax=Nonomuraea salmonea TaxID=46181 RepID=UPI002FE856EC
MVEKPGLRELKKQRTRQALIEAALRLFEDKGYENVTVAEIADAAEVSPAPSSSTSRPRRTSSWPTPTSASTWRCERSPSAVPGKGCPRCWYGRWTR